MLASGVILSGAYLAYRGLGGLALATGAVAFVVAGVVSFMYFRK